MNTSVFVEAIAGAVALIVAALSYLFTKVKEREADWRKWKYEQYKEFVATLGAMVGPKPTPESHRTFLKACNTLNLIGSGGVLTSLQAFIASMNADSPRREQCPDFKADLGNTQGRPNPRNAGRGGVFCAPLVSDTRSH